MTVPVQYLTATEMAGTVDSRTYALGLALQFLSRFSNEHATPAEAAKEIVNAAITLQSYIANGAPN